MEVTSASLEKYILNIFFEVSGITLVYMILEPV